MISQNFLLSTLSRHRLPLSKHSVRFEVYARRAIANYSAYNLCLTRISKPPHTCLRRRVRNDQQLIALEFTPATRVRISQFNEVDWSFILVVPGVGDQLALGGVDLQ